MKNIFLVFAVYFFMENYLVECAVIDGSNNELQYDPLAQVLYKLDDGKLTNVNVNPSLFEDCIKDDIFVDIVFACPNTVVDEKQTPVKNNEQPPLTPEQTLVIKMDYTTIVKQHEKQGDRDTTAVDDARNFKCQYPIRPYLFESKKKSTLYKAYIVGFEIDMGKYTNLAKYPFGNSDNENYQFSWVLTIVFNDHKLRVVCVHQEVQYNPDMFSREINESFIDHDFGKDVLFPNIDIANLYEKENQEKVFGKLFENEIQRKKYFDMEQNKILMRAHLAPLNGFITPVIRQSAKTYGNVAPMWNVIRNNAWRKVEHFIDLLTSRIFLDLTVVSGTYETLKLDGKEIYLADDDKVPVPLAFWKLVIHGAGSNESRGIFIVTVNNPYNDIGNIICEKDESEKYGWKPIQEIDHTKGRTIICEFPVSIVEKIPILFGSMPDHILDLNKVSEYETYSGEINDLGNLVKELNHDENEVQEERNKLQAIPMRRKPENSAEIKSLIPKLESEISAKKDI
ncbi:uncharacterized protein LOC135833623 [Planococcus citri]|uniref:uncharacterized protein LOC135833623 n=1 Tax=Planococcus citri TaxID=170843 RepID=UPI0031F8DBD4